MILKSKLIKRTILVLLGLYLIAICAQYLFVSSPSKTAGASAEINTSSASGDRATIIETGSGAMDARLNLIANAETSLTIGTYLFADDQSGRTITSALLNAADRGVHIRILTDGMIGAVNLLGSDLGYVLASHENIQMRYYNPVNLLEPWNLNARFHEKYVIADDHIMLLGGRNISNEFLTPADHEQYNYDMDVLIWREYPAQGSAIASVSSYFDELWLAHCAPAFQSIPSRKAESVQALRESLGETYASLQGDRAEVLAPIDWAAKTVPIDGFALLSNPTEPGDTTPLLWAELTSLMRSAKERIWIQTPYLVLNGQMRDDMEAIASLPTDLLVLTNSRAGGNNIVASADAVIHSGMLRRMDINRYEFQGDRSMHTKAMVIDDDISIIGSFNFDMRSAYIDTELMLVIKSADINQMLASHMTEMLSDSLPVLADGNYGDNSNAAPKSISFGKNLLILISSPFVSLFRYLV
ncbi:MAG: phosphatidylserine/phosphatidylglycerophosphate/cardiolipin synthase family protein [Clostridiales bacterium]|nr:phosphatidylserine/phosphatidylglycerophosphate/cardiolipin synthase family protein [Clostridiales bacterium]